MVVPSTCHHATSRVTAPRMPPCEARVTAQCEARSGRCGAAGPVLGAVGAVETAAGALEAGRADEAVQCAPHRVDAAVAGVAAERGGDVAGPDVGVADAGEVLQDLVGDLPVGARPVGVGGGGG